MGSSKSSLYSSFFVDCNCFFMNNQGPPDGPLFFPFHFTQQINVHVTISRKIHFMQRIVHLFGPEVLGEVLRHS